MENFRTKKIDEGEFELRTHEELRRSFGETNVIGIMKCIRIRWAGHVLVWKSEGVLGKITTRRSNTKWPRGRSRQRWADRVKENLRKIGVEMWRKCQETRKSVGTLLLQRWILTDFKMPKKKILT